MRKILSSVLVALWSVLPAGATTWGIIGEFTQWAEDFPMTEQPDGTYTATVPSISGEFKFRADNDWSVNFGAAAGLLTPISGNVTYPLAQDGANLRMAAPVENVTFTLNPAASTVVISGLPTDMEPVVVPEVKDLYLIGGPQGWSANRGMLMSHNLYADTYSCTISLGANDYYAFATRLGENEVDWATLNANRYGPAQNDMVPVEDAPNTLVKQTDSAWKCEKAGIYRMQVDLNAMTFVISEIRRTWGLVGDFCSWADDAEMTPTGEPGTYTVTVDNFSGDFKFRANHDWEYCIGSADGLPITADGTYAVSDNMGAMNLNIPQVAERVTFTLDTQNFLLKVSGIDDSGIEGISVDAPASTRYYNLQGIRVDNPADGIFIKVSGGKSSKVRF